MFKNKVSHGEDKIMKILNRIVLPVIVFAVLTLSAQVSFAKRQPAMENSLRALDNAERILRKALPNKGGHRAKALLHIRKAKQEIRRGIEFANRRPDGGQLKYKRGRKDDDHNGDRYRDNEQTKTKEKVMKKRY